MVSMATIHHTHWPLHLSLNHGRPSFPKPISSLRPILSPLKPLAIRASISDNASSSNPNRTKPSPLIQTTCAAIAAAAFFLARFNHRGAAIAATTVAPPPNESSVADSDSDAVAEKGLDIESLNAEELRSLMEEMIKADKIDDAIRILDRLIVLEPEDSEWPLLKANLFSYIEDYHLARVEFEAILKKDPLCFQAYHGLVMVASDSSNGDPERLEEVCQRVVTAMNACQKQKSKSDVRDFKLLIAQIRVMQSRYDEALKLFQELVKEEPRDYRPYLCQGMLYTLMKKNNEAEEQFSIFRRLVPKNHPFREYIKDNMMAAKLLNGEREAAGNQT